MESDHASPMVCKTHFFISQVSIFIFQVEPDQEDEGQMDDEPSPEPEPAAEAEPDAPPVHQNNTGRILGVYTLSSFVCFGTENQIVCILCIFHFPQIQRISSA